MGIPVKSLTDEQLVVHICENKNNDNAFEILFRRHRSRIYNLIRAKLSVHEDVEDVIQDIMIRVHSNLHKFDPQRSKFITWLTHITFNEVNRFLKVSIYNPKQAFPSIDGDVNDRLQIMVDPEGLDLEIAIDSVKKAAATLPKEQREVFMGYVFDGYSFQELADNHHAPLSTVLSQMKYARLKICNMLGHEYMGGVR